MTSNLSSAFYYSLSLPLLSHVNSVLFMHEQISPSQFEAHAGMAARRQP